MKNTLRKFMLALGIMGISFTSVTAFANELSKEKSEMNIVLEDTYIGGYTYGDVVEGKNEEFAEKYAALNGDLVAYEALEVPASLESIHAEIIAVRKELTEVTVDLILNGYSDEHQVAWDAYIVKKSALEDKLNAYFEGKAINTEEVFGVDMFEVVPLV